MGSSTYQGGSHLEFEKLPLEKGRKLHKYKIHNINFGYEIGEIHWRGGWRQYVFQAKPEIDMSRSCQKEITEFIDSLMEEWRNTKKNQLAKQRRKK